LPCKRDVNVVNDTLTIQIVQQLVLFFDVSLKRDGKRIIICGILSKHNIVINLISQTFLKKTAAIFINQNSLT
jgi:hypothetical protein